MDRSVLYVSTRCVPAASATSVIAAIIGPARSRNARLGVTGVLVATEHHFAQLLEGPEDAIETLMASIAHDERHRDVKVLRSEAMGQRRFARWSLAYEGHSAYFEGFIRPLVGQTAVSAPDVDRLIDLLERLAAPQPRRLSDESGSP